MWLECPECGNTDSIRILHGVVYIPKAEGSPKGGADDSTNVDEAFCSACLYYMDVKREVRDGVTVCVLGSVSRQKYRSSVW